MHQADEDWLKEIKDIGEDNKYYLESLIKQLQGNGVIPFIGAGTSIPFGMPGWSNFLKNEALNWKNKEVAVLIEDNNFEDAAESLYKSMGQGAFHDAIDRAYGDRAWEGQSLDDKAVSVLPNLAKGPVITTNYDRVLEKVFDQANKTFEEKVYGPDADRFAKAFQEGRNYILKLHGDVITRDNRVLTKSEYEKQYGKDLDGILAILFDRIRYGIPLLFIGCSLKEDKTLKVIEKSNKEQVGFFSYAILALPDIPDIEVTEKDFKDSNDHMEHRKKLSDLGIKPIWYPSKDNYAYLKRLLEYLANTVSQDYASNESILKNWHQFVEKSWDKNLIEDVDFIDEQGIEILPKKGSAAFPHLGTCSIRSGGDYESEAAADPDGEWEAIKRDELIARMQNDYPFDEKLQNIFVTADAGIGKSANLKWLWNKLNHNPILVFHFEAMNLPVGDTFLNYLAEEIKNIGENSSLSLDKVKEFVCQKAKENKLILIIDGLDQLINSDSLKVLNKFVGTFKCQLVLGGRPHAIAQFKKILKLDTRDWQFLRLKEFGREEQIKFLGVNKLNQINEDARRLLGIPRILELIKYIDDDEINEIHNDGDIFWLATHNLIVKSIDNSEYAKQIGQAKKQANTLENLHIQYRNNGNSIQLKYIYSLFSAIAYLMTLDKIRLDQNEGIHEQGELIPNFAKIDESKIYEFKKKIIELIRPIATKLVYNSDLLSDDVITNEINSDLNLLTSLGVSLKHPFFEHNLASELSEISWKNRSFQEFYAAYWLSNHSSDIDSNRFEDWIYYHEKTESDWYYYINRFLANMPEKALLSNKRIWIQTISAWYKPNQPCRSSEMIYRSWNKINKFSGISTSDWWNISYENLCQAEFNGYDDNLTDEERYARVVIDEYRNEFQSFLNSELNPSYKTAKSFIDGENWKRIPSGKLKMGSPNEQQGFPAKTKIFWERKIKDVLDLKNKFLMTVGDDFISNLDFQIELHKISEDCINPHWTCGARGTKIRKQDIEELKTDFLKPSEQEIREAIQESFRTMDETPQELIQNVKEFEIHSIPILNQTFRLFYPSHGDAQKLYFADLNLKRLDKKAPSPAANLPATYVSWYDAWAFCQWACWQDPETKLYYQCRLPHEPEWEFAAKGRTETNGDTFSPLDRYWWGNEFYKNEDSAEEEEISNNYAHAIGKRGVNRPPENADPNLFGLRDVLGNVWEWMANPYKREYSRYWPMDNDLPPAVNCARTMRGGLWYFLNLLSSCTQRFRLVCDDRDYKMGFRVIREVIHHRES